MKGTPLQAMKFAVLLNNDMSTRFMVDYMAGKDMGLWEAMISHSRDTTSEPPTKISFAEFCRQTVDRHPRQTDPSVDEHCVAEAVRDAVENGEGRASGNDVIDQLERQGYKLVPIEEKRADGRESRYGDGEQPWDTCLREGWAQYGAAFSILRYLRRTKEPERDLKHAKVYWGWLHELALIDAMRAPDKPGVNHGMALGIFRRLRRILTHDELIKLGVTVEQEELLR